ncbi:MAG: DUF2914 domain-containing protein [Calditrichaeota bacterium]|nr:MAG: DUF2914 domain-containing protein [Calditrichota bacterium]
MFLRLRNLYQRLERFNPVLFFFGGFTWDSLTLKRIDRMLDNLILLAYLLLLGALIAVVHLAGSGRLTRPLLRKYAHLCPMGLQFFLGGLFSAYVVFYFQSVSFTKTAIFLLILVALLVANEFLHHRLSNHTLLLCLYFVASFSFFIFFIPVVTHRMSTATYLAGGMLSLLLVLGLHFWLYRRFGLDARQFKFGTFSVLAAYAVINAFYWLNWIPPVPLSLKTGGIYHHVDRNPETGLFTLRYERPHWYEPFKNRDTVYHYAPGDTVSCFTAVFAPTRLRQKIYHHWQTFLPRQHKWVSTDRLGFEIIGYRDGGYRGVTRKLHITPGKWRVDVETEHGLLLGRIDFRIEERGGPVFLKTIYR